LWYARKFTISARLADQARAAQLLARVDWETTVWVNGKEVGKHQGGYDGFSFDITDTLHAKSEK